MFNVGRKASTTVRPNGLTCQPTLYATLFFRLTCFSRLSSIMFSLSFGLWKLYVLRRLKEVILADPEYGIEENFADRGACG